MINIDNIFLPIILFLKYVYIFIVAFTIRSMVETPKYIIDEHCPNSRLWMSMLFVVCSTIMIIFSNKFIPLENYYYYKTEILTNLIFMTCVIINFNIEFFKDCDYIKNTNLYYAALLNLTIYYIGIILIMILILILMYL